MNRAIVLISGGMDSLVTAAIADRENDELLFLHASYGQRTEAKELECFLNICDFYRPKASKIVNLTWLKDIGGSALTDVNMDISHSPAKDDEIPNTYVPFRNANLIAIATAWAEVTDANRIYIGAVEEDSSGYPDCREVFFDAMQNCIKYGTKNLQDIRIMTPVLHLSKAEIIKLGLSLAAPFEYSWSCYESSTLACGTCDSCRLRLKAFSLAGIVDPIKYQTR